MATGDSEAARGKILFSAGASYSRRKRKAPPPVAASESPEMAGRRYPAERRPVGGG